jgi:hypothetical protein
MDVDSSQKYVVVGVSDGDHHYWQIERTADRFLCGAELGEYPLDDGGVSASRKQARAWTRIEDAYDFLDRIEDGLTHDSSYCPIVWIAPAPWPPIAPKLHAEPAMP